MLVIRRCDVSIDKAYKNAVLAIGNFDGVHVGHQKLINEAVVKAKDLGVKSIVVTFFPHPAKVLGKDLNYKNIASFRDKYQKIKSLGVDAMLVIRFSKDFAKISPEAFIENLAKNLCPNTIMTGNNFCFGKNRVGDIETLRNLSSEYDYNFISFDHVKVEDKICSSSLVKGYIAVGDLQKVSQMIGGVYEITGIVSDGKKRGRVIGFPTANIRLKNLATLKFGVYAVKVEIDGLNYNGVANLGVRPTFGSNEVLLEVHIFDFDQEIYRKRIKVRFTDFLRDERRFDNVEQLKAEIIKDIDSAKRLLEA